MSGGQGSLPGKASQGGPVRLDVVKRLLLLLSLCLLLLWEVGLCGGVVGGEKVLGRGSRGCCCSGVCVGGVGLGGHIWLLGVQGRLCGV